MAAQIDSLKNYDSSIEDGTITVVRKGIIKKLFAKKTVGGYSNYYFSDRKTKKLYKVIYEQELGDPERISYYFDKDTLILAKTLTWDGNKTRTVRSSGQFYFFRDSLIKRTGNDSLTKSRYLLTRSKQFINDWHNKQDIGLGK